MKHESIHNLINDYLLIGSFSSFGFYTALADVSEFCRLILPITGVFSFLIYCLINWKALKNFFKGNK
jgi:hypothetical protein